MQEPIDLEPANYLSDFESDFELMFFKFFELSKFVKLLLLLVVFLLLFEDVFEESILL